MTTAQKMGPARQRTNGHATPVERPRSVVIMEDGGFRTAGSVFRFLAATILDMEDQRISEKRGAIHINSSSVAVRLCALLHRFGSTGPGGERSLSLEPGNDSPDGVTKAEELERMAALAIEEAKRLREAS